MDLTEFRAQLMLDLKMVLDTDISTAEANRCIFRAVDDMSRSIPRERIYEVTYKNEVTDDSFVAPSAQSDTTLVNNISISSASDGDMATLVTNWLDIPRPVKITIVDGDNSITRMTLIVKGRDADGMYREERFYRHDGKVQTGKIYFTSIKEIEINEISGNGSGDALSVGTGAITGIWIQLDNPVEPGTEEIWSGSSKSGTKYTLDTDYEMDYANGRINLKSGGSMSAGTTYYANYDKSNKAIDISAIIPELSRIIRVVYPVSKIPEQQVAFSIWENMMTVGSPRAGVSQQNLVDGDHMAIYYEVRQSPPTETGSGSYPEYLDQVVSIGAAGYALLMEALQYELQAVTDLGSMRTALGKVADYLETNGTTDNAKDVLANITDDASKLRTRIDAILSKSNDFLFNADTDPSAKFYLTTGDDKIDKLNDGGDRVAAGYADYARASMQLYQTLIAEANTRIANLRTYIEEASGWMRVGDTFIAEANSLANTIANDLLLSDRFRAEGNTRLAEFHDILRSRSEYRKRVATIPVRQPA